MRALCTATELRLPPATLNYITAPQIGVSRGRMRVGMYGGTTRRTYGVLGDEVNVAARLMQAAHPGQIFVTERVAVVTERFFCFERLTPLRVKGKTEPLGVLEAASAAFRNRPRRRIRLRAPNRRSHSRVRGPPTAAC